jgi:hypothetical protein
MQTRQFVDGKWEYKDLGRDLLVGDTVTFTGNGRGRGGHYSVTALVTKVNRTTFKCTELPGSYGPGTLYIWPKAPLDSPVTVILQPVNTQ